MHSNKQIIYLMIILSMKLVKSDWIDLPQFSDEFKVYRAPLTKSHRHKISIDKSFNITKNTLSNITEQNIDRSKEMMRVPMILNAEMTTLAYAILNTDDIENYTKPIKNPIAVSNYSLIDNFIFTNNSNGRSSLVIPTSQILLGDCDKKQTIKISDNETTTELYKLIYSNSEQLNDKGVLSFLQYLPMTLIKRAHAALLRNTLITIQDKQNYLKTFEKSILRKLESRLKQILHSVRRKRGSTWNDRDDHVGFPSLEGALLAISFLTFAVYLIQLVMMLMRNLANNGANNTNTVYVNRNKRSVYQFSEHSLQILEYLDKVSNN
ncbi:hypothetical protein PV327_005310 [Microctonus hyperodae]|uniref:Uncharacterized protein n=1 Tax=Microctonus hyperodae TaxID=165561 RepID=A0AA39G2I8_MICHY|nr:hypothetical protein PV327_005310 [Microctonus hyperodae]